MFRVLLGVNFLHWIRSDILAAGWRTYAAKNINDHIYITPMDKRGESEAEYADTQTVLHSVDVVVQPLMTCHHYFLSFVTWISSVYSTHASR